VASVEAWSEECGGRERGRQGPEEGFCGGVFVEKKILFTPFPHVTMGRSPQNYGPSLHFHPGLKPHQFCLNLAKFRTGPHVL
jgi:hypothetical protein